MTPLACLGMCWNSDRFYPCWDNGPEIREWIPEMNNWVLEKSERANKEIDQTAGRSAPWTWKAPFDERVGQRVYGTWIPPRIMRGEI